MLQRLGYFARETGKSLVRNWAMTVAGILTVAVSLALFGGTILNSRRVDHGTAKWRGNVGLEIFMRVDATENQKNDVQAELVKASKPDGTVKSFRYLSKQDAFKEFKRLFHDDPQLANSVTDPSVLPESFKVRLRDAAQTEEVRARFHTKPGVDDVVTPSKEIKKKLQTANRQRIGLWALSALLLLSAGVLIVNTIRLAMFARRREIEVMKLVGASNWFVRVPFMAEGFVQGIAGGLLAVGGTYLYKRGYEHWFYEKGYFITSSDFLYAAAVVFAIGGIIGLTTSFIGLRRFMNV